jgi:hypothetical protein
MHQKITWLLLFFLVSVNAQLIKTIQLRPLQENNFSAIVPLGTQLKLSFDDLEGDSKDYYYSIQHMTHDWQKSTIMSNQYINGFQKNSILDVNNSFNTFQSYTHYSVQIPNQNTTITKSGNYLITILDEYDDLVFSRRFTLYENKAIVGVSVNRSRNTKKLSEQQTIQFRVNHPGLRINNPSQEIKVAVLQNNIWESSITGLQPTFYKPNQLIYTHTSKTNFKGGNEFLFFDTKTIRNKSLNILHIEQKDIYHHYLYPTKYKEHNIYTYNPDINGQFVIRTLEGNNPQTEADYAMMHFSLEVETPFIGDSIYVYSAFNNFKFTDENKMVFNQKENRYVANILLKQGFHNYTFISKSTDNQKSKTNLRGDFYQTENEYTVLVYFKPFGGQYDRVIGVGNAFSEGER